MGFRQMPGRPAISPKRTSGWTVDSPVPAPVQSKSKLQNDPDGDLQFLEGMSSSVIDLCPLQTTFLEGKRLCSEFKLPAKDNRMLLSVLDLSSGDWIFDGWASDGEEPDLGQLIDPHQARPWLMATWILVNQGEGHGF